NLHFKQLNPYIDLANSPFYVVNKTNEWIQLTDQNNQVIPRRAGISSFGLGGSNAHLIIEEMITSAANTSKNAYYIVTLSAKNLQAFVEQQQNLLAWLDSQLAQDKSLSSISFTLNLGREHYDFRGAWLVSNKSE